MAADIFLSTDRPWQSGTPERIASRVARIPTAARIDSIEMVTMARPADERAGITKVVELRAVQPGLSVLRPADAAGWAPVLALAAAEQRRAGAAGASRAVRPGGRRRDRDRQGAVHRPRRHRARARALAERVQSRAARVHRLRRSGRDGVDRVRQPRLAPDAASSARARDRHAHTRAAGRAQTAVRARPLVSRSSGADRRGLRARGELSQPRRPRHRRARRHRRVERDARVRAAEDQEHRGDEVRRRHEPADSGRVSSAVARARHHRQPHRRRPGVDRHRGDSRRHESDRHADGGVRRCHGLPRLRESASACSCLCCSRWFRCSKCGR